MQEIVQREMYEEQQDAKKRKGMFLPARRTTAFVSGSR